MRRNTEGEIVIATEEEWVEGFRQQEQEASRRKAAERTWRTGRRQLVMDEFVCPCPHCGHKGCSPIERLRDVQLPYADGVAIGSITDGWYCNGCTVQFRDPEKFAKNCDELAEMLVDYDIANKPEWLP